MTRPDKGKIRKPSHYILIQVVQCVYGDRTMDKKLQCMFGYNYKFNQRSFIDEIEINYVSVPIQPFLHY